MSYVDVETLKTYIGASEDTDDYLLELVLDWAERRIETYTGRVFEAASGTKYYDWKAVSGLYLWLGTDFYSLTSIANGNSDSTEIPTSDVTLWPRNEGPPYYKIRLNSGSAHSWIVDTDYWIEVTGLWGYSATPPSDILRACVRLAAYYYRQRDTGAYDAVAVSQGGNVIIPQGMPRSVQLVLNPYRRGSL